MTNRKSVMQKIDYNKIYNKNCLEGMKLIPKNKIDLIITDPPFAMYPKRIWKYVHIFRLEQPQRYSNCY